MENSKIQKLSLLLFLFAIIIFAVSIFAIKGENISIKNDIPELPKKDPPIVLSPEPIKKPEPLNRNLISGISCPQYNRRAFAITMAGDSISRPLSGLSSADLIMEMPVITDSINRFIAFFVCQEPEEIGAVRSARHDFIPLVQGFDAIFVHWGGSHFALNKLNKGVMDNIDALRDYFNIFYRKKGLPMPHNGFTSFERLVKAAEKYDYRLSSEFEGYSFLEPSSYIQEKKESLKCQTAQSNCQLEIGYPGIYKVKYQYNPETSAYLRWRGGKKEIDKLNNEQISAKNIVIMRAVSRQIERDYNDLDIEGEGTVAVYRLGEEIKGIWRKDKDNPKSKLYFLDDKLEEIKFAPGQIWIQIVQPNQSVEWITE